VALATNWALFQTLVYDTLFKAPTELGGLLLDGQRAPFDPYAGCRSPSTACKRRPTLGQPRRSAPPPLQGGPGFAAFAVNTGGMIMLLSTLGVVLASKVVLAVLLALAPLIAGLLLFEATQGLVEGWLKAMIALAVAADGRRPGPIP
jgi:type IV secretion system protein VirB6